MTKRDAYGSLKHTLALTAPAYRRISAPEKPIPPFDPQQLSIALNAVNIM